MSLTNCLAIDCERVQGVNRKGFFYEMVGRVTIVNEYEQSVLDTYVRPIGHVTDYRTRISGLRPRDLANGDDFYYVRETVRRYIKGRVIVGHALDHDLRALRLSHPEWNIRDTATYEPFIRMNRNRTPSLRFLARRILRWNIQRGEHSSFEDALAAMRIYKIYQCDWDYEYYGTESESESEEEEYEQNTSAPSRVNRYYDSSSSSDYY